MTSYQVSSYIYLADYFQNNHPTYGSHNQLPLRLVIYYIPHGFTPTIVPHGNSKSEKATLPSISAVIKKKCMSDGPKEVLSSMECTAGGILDATCPGQLPCNEQQINFKHYAHEGTTCSTKGNELYSIMLWLIWSIRIKNLSEIYIKTYPEPPIVLATDQQLFDVQRFCCDPQQFSTLTVDTMYSLGDFDVTLTTYRHLMLLSKRTNTHPVMLGQIMIHYKKTFTTYKFFATCLVTKNRELQGLRAFGTDGEKNLYSEYIKSQLLNKDSRFRKNAQYVFYLLLQKEIRELSAGVYNLLKCTRSQPMS